MMIDILTVVWPFDVSSKSTFVFARFAKRSTVFIKNPARRLTLCVLSHNCCYFKKGIDILSFLKT